MTKSIGLFGGSFDPPHLGHQALLEAALEQLQLDEIWVIPVGTPVHRDLSGKATPQQRFHWLKTMFQHHANVKVMDWELNSEHATPAIQTLQYFQQTYPQCTPFWLMGMDSYAHLQHWVGYPAHQKLCNLAVFQRQGYADVAIFDGWKHLSSSSDKAKKHPHSGHITFIPIDLPDISSSKIRSRVTQHQHQLPQSTCNAISVCYASALTDSNKERTHDTNHP